jgi:hypothetical protein
MEKIPCFQSTFATIRTHVPGIENLILFECPLGTRTLQAKDEIYGICRHECNFEQEEID